MGADVIIAVDLGSGILGRRLRPSPSAEAPGSAIGDWMRRVQDNLGAHVQPQLGDEPTMPSIHDVSPLVVAVSMGEEIGAEFPGFLNNLAVDHTLIHIEQLKQSCSRRVELFVVK